jgi:hypothetical protein
VKSLIVHILLLLLLCFLIVVSGFFLAGQPLQHEFLNSLFLLTSCFFTVTLVSVLIFHHGLEKEPRSQTFHTFVAISLKFLLELVLALIWFIVIKKTGTQSVLMFFVLYLSFSLFLIILILKTLKTKSL